MRVTSVSLGISGGEHGVDQQKSADNLGSEGGASAETVGDEVSSATMAVVSMLHERFYQGNADNGSETLRRHVSYRSDHRHLSRQQQPKRHGWIYMPT